MVNLAISEEVVSGVESAEEVDYMLINGMLFFVGIPYFIYEVRDFVSPSFIECQSMEKPSINIPLIEQIDP